MKLVRLAFATTKPVLDILDGLVKTGLYGEGRSQAAERILAQALLGIVNDQGPDDLDRLDARLDAEMASFDAAGIREAERAELARRRASSKTKRRKRR